MSNIEDNLIGTTVSHYRIEGQIGRGGMGVVYRARDSELGRDVALKFLKGGLVDDGAMDRFHREARLLASLNHPNIATIHGIEGADSGRFLVLELIEGETLAERLASKSLAINDALDIARQVADALEAAHAKGIMHRDLKPGNIKITPDGRVKVLDFGLAKALDPRESGSGHQDLPTVSADPTTAGIVRGTPAYMSPEQARGEELDHRTDIWAFGCVLHEMLTGRRAFPSKTGAEALGAILYVDPDWSKLPTETPDAIRRLLRRCLSKEPKTRVQHIGDVRLELEEELRGDVDTAGQVVASSRSRSTFNWMVASAVIAIIVIVALVILSPNVFEFGSSIDGVEQQFVLPISTPPTLNPESFALAPDGTKMVLTGFDEDGVDKLWLQQLDAPQSRSLEGTEGARFPFWSPDSRSVGFFADAQLKRIDLESGFVRELGRAVVGSGGSWNADDVIVFSPTADAGLVRISADGGEIVRATLTGGGQRDHRFPHFLPDSRHFLYYASGDPSVRGIYVGELIDEPPPPSPFLEISPDEISQEEAGRIFESYREAVDAYWERAGQQYLTYADDAAAYVSTEHLLYPVDGTLQAQRFDPDRLELEGSSIPVAENVRMPASASMSGTVAYRTGSQVRDTWQLRWFDRDGNVLDTVGSPFGFLRGAFELSPNEDRILLTARLNGILRLWMTDLEDGAPRLLTFGAGGGNFAIWSPDGTEILFQSEDVGVPSIFRQPADGGEEATLVLRRGTFPAAWSPDGETILLANISTRPIGVFRINEPTGLNADRGNPSGLAETIGMSPQFSPGGGWIAYTSDADTEQHEIFVQRFPGPAGKQQISFDGGGQPHWQADSSELFYVAPDGRLMAVPIRISPNGQTLEADSPVPLFQTDMTVVGSSRHQYAPSRDGQRFLINTIPLPDDLETEPLTVLVNWQPDQGR